MSAELIADFESRAFRKILGQFATGVAVVTATAPITLSSEEASASREESRNALVGMTMSSFNSVSLDPALVLFSVAKSAHSLPAMRRANAFGINVLGRHQQAISAKFSRALGDKWEDVEHHITAVGAPLLKDAIAHLECVPHAVHDGGDHEIFLARVLHFSAAHAGDPLIFFQGAYHALAANESATL
ncbi:MAG TPA: flavin reductase family protein [Beijerinckiaceae bacterium]|jgi:flavin reductase (DIM6/NTAB) family NADH-FMN oxidoreductase RutF|nr:flavin reductase family protein [Beijerinckiaceae bacterium]